jgi:hypothetical protein
MHCAPLAYLLVVNTEMIGRDQYQIELRDYRLIRLIFSQPIGLSHQQPYTLQYGLQVAILQSR